MTEERIVLVADRNLYFPGVEKFREALVAATAEESDDRNPCLLIDLAHVKEIDYTALKVNAH